MVIISDDVIDETNYDEVNNNVQPYASQNIKYEYNGHTYSFIDIGMTWNNAKLYCENEGGHLATITSPEENDFLVDLINNGSMNTYWIGLTDGGGSDYKWITGEPFVELCGTIANYNTRQYFYQLQKDGIWNDHDDGLRNDFWDYTKCGILCEWDYIDSEPIPDELNYTVFSGSTSQGVSLYGWKSYFTGDIYTGNNFTYGGSELYVSGKIDAAGTITTNGWITEITERNEAVNAIAMPDYDEAIEENAQPYEYFEESPAYVQDRNIINSSIKVGGEVIISGTTFEGDCYIIAEGNITYNVQDFNSAGRVFLYSKNGNITINGSQININGAMYAPKGNVTFNTYDTTITGFVCADTINFNGSLFNITGANFDMVKPKPKGIIKTYTLDEDFNEGSFDGISLAVPDQLILAEKEAGEETELEKIYGNTESGKGVKVTLSSDKSILSENDDSVNIKFGLSGFGSADVNENAIDLILVIDESGSMGGSRMTNTKSAAKEIISQMKDNDRCAVIGFTYGTNARQSLTSDKTLLNKAVDNLYAYGGTNISAGINRALDMFNTMSDDSRQKYIILLSDGEDEYVTASLNAATKAGENNIRIFAMTIGTGTLQMQNIAINSNGIYKNAPTSADIGKIMSYFASEVFNVAGRNTTFRTTITDKNSIDLTKIIPEPANVTENADGSVTLEWNLDRISIEDIKTIDLPLSVTNSSDGFAELTQNSSCVYYDREGKPHIIYIDDVILPVSKYKEKGNWSVIFDSEKDNVDWTHIYWNGKRFGDGKISVSASACNDGANFGEPVSINNYEDISELCGQYVKLDVQLTASSDGKTPELFDITIMSKEAELPEYSNAEPTAEIISKNATKVNVPMNVRADISDDCLKSDITIEWSSESDKVSFSDNASLITNASISETGSYEIVCTVTDGENTVTARKTISCAPADSYADIDPDKQEALAPEISVDLPQYADRKQVINAKIENLNNTEISWYSVIFNKNTPVNVDDDGNFSLTMPNKDGKFPVVVRAFDWSGKSDVKEYEIIVDNSAPTVSVTASSENVSIGDEAYFEINTTVENKIASIEYTLNYEAVTVTDGKYILDTSEAGIYTLTANAVTTAGKTITASASIIVEDNSEIDTEAPVVDLSFDKDAYSVGDTITAEIIASDNVGVTRLEAFVNDAETENGNLSTKTDAMGNVTSYGYDSSGNMLSMTDAEGHSVSNSYNSKGQLTSINAMGINAMTVQYDSKGNTTSTTDTLGNDINYSYDGKGQLTSVTDEIGTYMNMTYDRDGNVVSATNGAGTTAQFTYDSDGNCTSKTLTYTSENGIQTVTEQYFYDAAGNLTKIIDSDGNVTTTDYNSMGKVSSATDEKGRTTTYDYDDFGNLIGISYPDGTSERFTYDREGNNLTATDRMGRTVTMTYDKVGNLLSKTYPNGARVTYSYDANYNLISETSASGGVTNYEYDKIGRNTAITDALGNRTAFSYNAKSQLESMTDPMGRVYTYVYDDNGNRIKTVYPDGSSVSSAYDARGRVTSQTDQHGYSTNYAYDGSDRLTGVTNTQGITTSYDYDEVGNMTSVTDGNGNVTRYSYDDFGRVVKVTNALGNSAYTTYDESGNVLTSTDYSGNVTTYTYDNFDRVSSKTTPDGTVSYTYTTDGKLSSVTDNSGVTMFTYDNMDGLTRVDYPDGSYVAYDYDNACRLTRVSTPFGDTAYEYDMLDRLTRVVDRNGYATIYEYDANGNRTAVRYANGYTTTYDYDILNRLIKQETLDNDGEAVVQYIYTLGAAGERLSIAELGRTVEYTYDNLYRLTGETITEGEKVIAYTYAYDSVGNRILKTKNGAETEYTYNELNQILSEDDTTYEYDLNGNLVRVIGGVQSALYEYNSENKLVKATVQSGSLVTEESYTYDYAGNRTSKTTSTSDGNFEVVKYLNDNSSLTNVLAELDSEGNVQAYYTIGADLISQERNGRTYTYLYDGHGSAVGLMNEDGSVTDTYTYDAFGNLLKSSGRTANNYRYCGEQFDSTTGLYYLRARYMDTPTGRFISQDSYAGSVYDPVSLHKYLYANSNPVMYSDPSGYIPAVEGNLALALAGDEYAMNRLAIQMTTSEMGYYSRDPRSIGQHISDVIFIGLSIIAALTAVVININMMYEQMDAVITDCASGNTTSAETNTEYRDSKCNNSTNEPVRRNYLDTDADFDDVLVSNSGTQFWQNDIAGWIEDNKVPSDAQTILKNPKFKKTKIKNKGAIVYSYENKYYCRDTFHTGKSAHLEVFDRFGNHIGEANPQTGEIDRNKADPTKHLNVR